MMHITHIKNKKKTDSLNDEKKVKIHEGTEIY